MQQFKRGIDPKEAMGVGEVAITQEIKTFYELDPKDMISVDGGKMIPRRHIVGPSYVHSILQKIKDGKPDKKMRFYAAQVEGMGFVRLHKYTGHYLKFEGITYKIHESLQKK